MRLIAILALSDGAWGLLGIVVVQTFGIVALFINSRRTRIDVNAINRAVNHQPPDQPTLVERVGIIERDTTTHREWEQKALNSIATEIGVELPAYPPPEER